MHNSFSFFEREPTETFIELDDELADLRLRPLGPLEFSLTTFEVRPFFVSFLGEYVRCGVTIRPEDVVRFCTLFALVAWGVDLEYAEGCAGRACDCTVFEGDCVVEVVRRRFAATPVEDGDILSVTVVSDLFGDISNSRWKC